MFIIFIMKQSVIIYKIENSFVLNRVSLARMYRLYCLFIVGAGKLQRPGHPLPNSVAF